MSSPSGFVPAERTAQTARCLRALLGLCMSCALFVAVAFGVIATPREPTVAAQTPAKPPIAQAPLPGG
jgi:hypothetical protein